MDFTKEYKEVLAGGQEMTVKITATIEGKIADIKEPLHIVAVIFTVISSHMNWQ